MEDSNKVTFMAISFSHHHKVQIRVKDSRNNMKIIIEESRWRNLHHMLHKNTIDVIMSKLTLSFVTYFNPHDEYTHASTRTSQRYSMNKATMCAKHQRGIMESFATLSSHTR